MKKAQIISMDFIMTFVVYIFALSVFFFALGDALPTKDVGLDVQADLLLNKLAEINEDVDFLDNSKIDDAKMSSFKSQYNYDDAYNFIFRDFDNPAFTRTDYCIYLENPKTNVVLKNIAAGAEEDYNIYFTESEKCGSYTGNNRKPYCSDDIKAESIVLTKPAMYNSEIVNLKILICAEKR